MNKINQTKHTYDKFNYWQIDVKDLPSKGRLYPKDVKIKIRSMSVLEVKFLATLSPLNSTSICNELLEKCCILENMKFEDLILSDREFLIFWIRLNSFTSTNGFVITIPHCSECKTKIEKTIKLTELQFKYLDEPPIKKVHLNDINVDIPLKFPKYADSKIKTNDEIEEMCIWIGSENTMEEKYAFLSNLTAYDFLSLKQAIDNNYCGVVKEIDIPCPKCGKLHPVKITINDDNLFNSVNLMQVLETITRIAKYANLQITNDWTWVEVEVEQQIINKMIQEENEANKKELANAKAKAGSVSSHIPSTPSLPSIHH